MVLFPNIDFSHNIFLIEVTSILLVRYQEILMMKNRLVLEEYPHRKYTTTNKEVYSYFLVRLKSNIHKYNEVYLQHQE